MLIGKIEVPYFIFKLEDHLSIKSELLDLLDNAPGTKSIRSTETIYKSDWQYNQYANSFRKNFVESSSINYFKKLEPYINKVIDEVVPKLNKDPLAVSQGWFHQYKKMNYYFYHWHPGVRWGLVYYLELPKNGPKTEFENFFGQPITVDVNEGDLLLFPGWLKHRSPPNLSEERKTIIAFNLVEKGIA